MNFAERAVYHFKRHLVPLGFNIQTIIALILWGLIGVGITPYFGSIVIHLFFTPIAIYALMMVCHWVGWNKGYIDREEDEKANQTNHAA